MTSGLQKPSPTGLPTFAGVQLCHPKEECAGCDVCLRAIARVLAREMDYDLEAAMHKTTEAYRAELGVDHCTHQQAHDLGLMTAAICWYRLRDSGVQFSPHAQSLANHLTVELASVDAARWQDRRRPPKRRRKFFWLTLTLALLGVGFVAVAVFTFLRAS